MTVTLPRTSVVVAFAATLLALTVREMHPSAVLVVAAAGAVGLAIGSKSSSRRARLPTTATVAGAGMIAFALTATLWSQEPARVSAPGLAATLVAAVAEEAFFRHGMYAVLERYGAGAAVAATSLAFALVHAPAYGWRAAAFDVAAGGVFGWQRWATGRWSVSAATHAVANLLAVL
jgi:membrane protease YdiL (CAAX protease family)